MNTFRKILLPITFCFLALSISSCSDVNDDLTPVNPAANAPTPPQKIAPSILVGDWEMVSLNYAGTSTDVMNGQTYTISFNGVGRDFTYQITFTDNPKIYVANGGYTIDLTSIFDGQTNTQTTIIPNTSSSGTWSLVGNTLTITDSNTKQSNSTEILTGSQNSFSYDFAGFNSQSVSGANVEFTAGEVSFQRL